MINKGAGVSGVQGFWIGTWGLMMICIVTTLLNIYPTPVADKIFGTNFLALGVSS